MATSAEPSSSLKLLVIAPTGRDASLIITCLGRVGIDADPVASPDQLQNRLALGSGGIVIAEEALAAALPQITAFLSHQPSWSDLPIVLLTRAGANRNLAARAVQELGNVMLLERPVRISSLVSAAKTLVRARIRQYEARRALESLRTADRRKDEFLATLAHELRNPLAPIRNSVEVLRLAELPLAATAPVQMIGRQLTNLVRLVDDLLEVGRITRGQIVLRPVPCDLAAVLDVAIEASLPNIREHGHELALAVPDGVALFADPTRLAQVFTNLLNNAARYTDDGGRIELRAEPLGDQVSITVRDTGIGMDDAIIPHVFEPFIQGNRSPDNPRGGLGIGLTLVRMLVESHGGRVSASSAGKDQGSTFVVTLPVRRWVGATSAAPTEGALAGLSIDADAVAMDSRPFTTGSVTPASQRSTEPPVAKPVRVLVVDDNEDAANSLGELLSLLGATVSIRFSATLALADLDGIRPDIAFLDLGMPGMDGYALARAIRARSDPPQPVLVALTGWGQKRDLEATSAAGYDHHLVKPAELGRLQAILAAG